MNSLKLVLLTATLMLAMAFTFSCSSDDDDGGSDDPFSGIPGYEDFKERLKYYDPDDVEKRCQNGVVEGRCEVDGNDIWYSPLTYVCHDDNYGLETIKRCGNQLYISLPNGPASNARLRCQGGALEGKCEDVWYNEETHYCDWDYDYDTGIGTSTVKAKERCGNKYYYDEKGYYEGYRCQNEILEERCGGVWYNEETHYCDWSTSTVKAIERCGSGYIDDYEERCNNGAIEDKCGDVWFNRITQSCDWRTGTVKNKVRCGS
jgi:hypothetical protein